MASSFQVGPSVLGLVQSGIDHGAGAVTGVRTQCQSGSGAGNGAIVRPVFRDRIRTDATPVAGAGVWAKESGICIRIGFIDVIMNRLSVFHGVHTDPGTTNRVLFYSISI